MVTASATVTDTSKGKGVHCREGGGGGGDEEEGKMMGEGEEETKGG